MLRCCGANLVANAGLEVKDESLLVGINLMYSGDHRLTRGVVIARKPNLRARAGDPIAKPDPKPLVGHRIHDTLDEHARLKQSVCWVA